MISTIIPRGGVLAFSLAASLLFILQGCLATRDWVSEQVSSQDKRVADVQGRLDQVGNRLSGTEGRISSAEGRLSDAEGHIGQVDAKAEKALSSLANLRLERRLVLDLKEGANFAFNSAALPEQAKKEIDAFLSDLKGDLTGTESAMFLLAGHTDNTGTDDHNYELGRKRAESVAKYLILQKKVDPMRVVTISYGKSAPLAENNTREGRGKNRRVEILVYRDNITTASEQVSGQGRRADFPLFAWPPPRASASDVIPRELLEVKHGVTRLRDVDRRITKALEQNGYYESSYYAVPGGFALVTKMEQIQSDGTSKQEPDRWSLKPLPLGEFSLPAYLAALFRATGGYYRLIVFVVTPYSFGQSATKVRAEEAIGWLSEGLNRLPAVIGDLDFSRGGYACTALIYEFERPSETEEPKIRLPGLIPGRTHLVKAGIWKVLQ